jgi:hypothetical protein
LTIILKCTPCIVIKIYKKKKEGVSSRTISPPIADPIYIKRDIILMGKG